MPPQIITVGFCPQYFATFEVAGSKGAVYTVTTHGGEAPSECTCQAFHFSGAESTCKHVKMVWDHGCLWNPQWKDAGANDLAKFGIKLIEIDRPNIIRDERCPGCGDDMIAVRIAV